MNRKIDKLIPKAIDALKDTANCKISTDGRSIDSAYRSAISSFGAAITLGSLKAAVAVFTKDAEGGEAGIKRSELLRAIHFLVFENEGWPEKAKDVFNRVIAETAISANERSLRQRFINAAVALKLAMNAFELTKKENIGGGEGAES